MTKKAAPTKHLNRSLQAAKATKQDEFYTQLPDIEKELRHYAPHFKGKTVLCNCDDPRVSNFFRYFTLKFRDLGLKKLVTTCYQNTDGALFSRHEETRGLLLEYTGGRKSEPAPRPEDVKPRKLKGDGDFRSDECVDLMKQSDIVVTNPPFSLFREYVELLIAHKKKFLIIGNSNAISYREVFNLITADKIWLGYSHPVEFRVPDHYEMREVRSWRDEQGNNWRSLGNACWFTNLDIAKRHEELPLYASYTPGAYPEYDNFKAIEVGKYKEIPHDYDGVMGVPLTFLEHHNPEQFEIVGADYQVKDGLLPELVKPGWDGKLDRAYVNGKRKYSRMLIRRRG